MRIASWNVLGGRTPGEDRVDEHRFAAAVAALDADLLGLQEVDRDQPRSQHVDLTAVAAAAMGAREHRFVAALAGTPGTRTWTAASGNAPPDGASFGIAFLSRHPVSDWRVVRLPAAPVPHVGAVAGRRRFGWVRDEPRVALTARVLSPAGTITVVTTHLGFLPGWNRHQLRLLLRSLVDVPDPVVLMGDLNMRPRPAHRITGMRPLAGGATFPAQRPGLQLDHVLVRDARLAGRGGPVALPISDHRALLAEVEPG